MGVDNNPPSTEVNGSEGGGININSDRRVSVTRGGKKWMVLWRKHTHTQNKRPYRSHSHMCQRTKRATDNFFVIEIESRVGGGGSKNMENK